MTSQTHVCGGTILNPLHDDVFLQVSVIMWNVTLCYGICTPSIYARMKPSYVTKGLISET
ncbi:uncharacterized protein LOC126560603 [Anopheles maculipalpis]|uniref:uncharacterized protein LOC126560603 n=1 Tax=Anopheles maculipalpis TaxID=1496333 RepID=UPI002158BA7C|nr:uncharacterized protein LOC126560603 [Anopheles maculipalpis]